VHRRGWIAVGAIALLGGVLVVLTMRHGVGLGGPDSAVYLGVAHNVQRGHGPTMPFTVPTVHYSPERAASFGGVVPLTHFPPLYPTVLGIAASAGLAVASAARALNAVLMVANLVLVGLLVRRVTRSAIVVAAVIVLVLVGPTFPDGLGVRQSWLLLHAQVMSEPLFLCATLVALLELSYALVRVETRHLVGAGAAAAVATLTRYAGWSTVVAGAVALACWAAATQRERLRAAAMFLGCSAVPSLLWVLYASLAGRGSSVRALHVHTLPFGALFDALEAWFMPASWSAGVRHGVLVALAVVVTAAIVASRHDRSAVASTLRLCTIWLVAYSATIVLTRDLLDKTTPIDGRILAPGQPVAYVALVASCELLFARMRDRDARLVPALTTVVVVLVALPVVRPLFHTVDDGVRQWQKTPTSELAARVPAGSLIFTNQPDDVFLATRRSSIGVPSRVEWTSGRRNPDFDREVHDVVALLRKRPGVILLAPVNYATVPLATPGDFTRAAPMRVVQRARDGGVLLELATPIGP
jgi:hypothetical protein